MRRGWRLEIRVISVDVAPSASKTSVGGVRRFSAVVGLVIGLHPEPAARLGVVDGRGGEVAVSTDGDQSAVMVDRLKNKISDGQSELHPTTDSPFDTRRFHA